ncbi:MAG TPA: M20/M25/M40 family metallo-hydrolase [Steroidobacteraceae bacterium]|nr:M20/M25/M40 family metallo-hydrolase [Steroidobacteraceae bacterium]
MIPIRAVRMVALALVLGLGAPLAARADAAPSARTTPRSPAEYEHLAHDIFAELVGMNTTHAVGSTQAARALAARLVAAGIPASDVYVGGPRPDKMNVVVRLRGRGKGKPVLYNGHLDVVEARREAWTVDPFQLTEKDGYYYGRGTVDMKNEVAVMVTNLIRLQREGYRPDRDLILALTTDEEAGGDANGAEWLLREQRELVDAGLVINTDGGVGGGQSLNGEQLWIAIQTAEKQYVTYTLTTHGAGGHSSLPTRDNAIARLARALVRLAAYQFPVRLSATTRAYLEALKPRLDAAQSAAIAGALADPPDPQAVDALRDTPALNAQIHSTCPATVVEAGQSESALPVQARATIQCRLLPDENPDEVVATLKRVIDDPQVEVGVGYAAIPSPATPLDETLRATVARITQAMWPGLGVVPVMSAVASDNVYWRGAGLPTFGVSGSFMDQADVRMHGVDERIGVTTFYKSLEFGYRLMKALTGGR